MTRKHWKIAGCTAALSLALTASAPAHAAETAQPKELQCGDTTDNPELSIKLCTRLIEFGSLDRPELAKAYYVRGIDWASLGKYDRAINDFSMAIELDPELSGVRINRALAYSERGEHERAIADYDEAIRRAPRETRAYIGRAVEWTMLGDYKRAIADYNEVIRLEPRSISGYFGRGRVRFYAGDFLAAASDFVRSHRLQGSVYTALWLFLARKRAEIPGEKTLAQEAGTSGQGDWPAAVVGLYLGTLTPEAVQKAAADPDPARQRDQRCEASFYLAHWHLMAGAREPAATLLADARRLCSSTFIEHEGAVAELRRLKSP